MKRKKSSMNPRNIFLTSYQEKILDELVEKNLFPSGAEAIRSAINDLGSFHKSAGHISLDDNKTVPTNNLDYEKSNLTDARGRYRRSSIDKKSFILGLASTNNGTTESEVFDMYEKICGKPGVSARHIYKSEIHILIGVMERSGELVISSGRLYTKLSQT